jgi:methylenetetrahydrofolate dehydrogenase (NADP+)/methenyltetrahydrofolate cyclohydrolase
MTAKIIDGKKLAENVLENIKKRVANLKEKPGLAIVLVGNNPASQIYVGFKEKRSKEVGFYCERYDLSEDVKEEDLLELIDDLNQKRNIHGIIVQLPLPKHINEDLIIDAVLPHKDVDGFTPVNAGNLVNDNNMIVPATARACIELIKSTGETIEGKNAVIIGRSKIVGKPVSLLLLQENATVTICHSKTRELKEHTKNADILIAAAGYPKLVKKNMVKEGAIVIDIGINRTPQGIAGDVDFEAVKEVASYITPVPGGVGPMTIAMLLENTLDAMEILGNTKTL